MSHSKHLIQAKCPSLRPDTNELTVLLSLRFYLLQSHTKRPLLLLDLIFKELLFRTPQTLVCGSAHYTYLIHLGKLHYKIN